MNTKVLILLSSYNGKEGIRKQVQSILDQSGVDIHIQIRDDGSSAYTKAVLKDIITEYNDRVQCTYGPNIGWKQSFMDLLYAANQEYDYYGFSDQDDIWRKDKVLKCIQCMETESTACVKLCHCNCLSVNEKLVERNEQEIRIPCPPSHKAAVATEYFQGCGMLWNKEAMKVIQTYKPQNKELAHDYWVGLVCFFFGKICFCKTPLFYHIRYEFNSSEDGNIIKGRLKRFNTLISGKDAYMNPATDLLVGFSSMLSKEDKLFLEDLSKYKNRLSSKWRLILDKKFRRTSFLSSVLLKTAIIFNRY